MHPYSKMVLISMVLVLLIGCSVPQSNRTVAVRPQKTVAEVTDEKYLEEDVEQEFMNLLFSQPTDYSAEYVTDWSYKSTRHNWYKVHVAGGQVVTYESKTSNRQGSQETGCDTLFSGGTWVKHDCIVYAPGHLELVQNSTLPSAPPQTPDQEKKEEILKLLSDNNDKPLGLKRVSADLGRTCFYESEQKERTNVPYIYCFKDGLLVNYYYDIWSFKEDFSVVGYPVDELVSEVRIV